MRGIHVDRTPHGEQLRLLTPDEFGKLPSGAEVISAATGQRLIKGQDRIDLDTRSGHLGFGVPTPNPAGGRAGLALRQAAVRTIGPAARLKDAVRSVTRGF